MMRMSDKICHIMTMSEILNIIQTLEVTIMDGPFKNATLSGRWKRYGKDLVSDAASPQERVAQACYSMLGGLDMKALSPLLSALRAEGQQPQVDLDPISSVEAIFESHAKSPWTDTLQKHLIANLQDRMSVEEALDQALPGTVVDWIDTTKNRLDEHCIRARDRGDMNVENYRKGIERNHEAFGAIQLNELCRALVTGNGRAFNQATRKRIGVDEGPGE